MGLCHSMSSKIRTADNNFLLNRSAWALGTITRASINMIFMRQYRQCKFIGIKIDSQPDVNIVRVK